MNKNNFKIVVIVTPLGVESVTVHSKDFSDRITAYSLCEKLESNFQEINNAVLAGQELSNETNAKNFKKLNSKGVSNG